MDAGSSTTPKGEGIWAGDAVPTISVIGAQALTNRVKNNHAVFIIMIT